MNILMFYIIACCFMGVSAFLSGFVWAEANGPAEYINLLFVKKPFIIFATTGMFITSGVLTQYGRVAFNLSYYEMSVIWIATVWVSVTVIWLLNGIKPSGTELIGYALCQAGLLVVALSKYGI